MIKYDKVAEICFETRGNTYKYALYDHDIQPGDYVVVMTGHHGMALGMVGNVINVDCLPDNEPSVRCNRQVICKVDMTAYNARVEKEEKLKAIKKQLDARVEQLQNLALYEVLAEKDEGLKMLLDEYKGLVEC